MKSTSWKTNIRGNLNVVVGFCVSIEIVLQKNFRSLSQPGCGARSVKSANEFTFHCLRHTWASWHVMEGTPLSVLQTLGGWRSLDMVQRYAHLAPDFIASYAENSTLGGVQKGVQKNGADLKLVATT